MKTKISIIILLFSLLSAEVGSGVATSAGNWLKLDSGARNIALGGSGVASNSGVSSIPLNPALITQTSFREVYYAKSELYVGISHNLLGTVFFVSPSDYVGLHLFWYDSGNMDVTIEDYPTGTGEEFNVLGVAFRTAYAKKLNDYMSVAASLNYFREQIYTVQMQSIALDFGFYYRSPFFTDFGVSWSNLGPEVNYSGDGLEQTVPDDTSVNGRMYKETGYFKIPSTLRAGAFIYLMGYDNCFVQNDYHSLNIAIDFENANDYDSQLNTGLEYTWYDIVFLRGGLVLGHDTASFSTGAGFRFKLGNRLYGVNYAMSNYGDLKNTSQFDLSVKF